MKKLLFFLTASLTFGQIDLLKQTKSSCSIGYVFFAKTGGGAQCDSSIFWDNTNKLLGIRTVPSTPLSVKQSANTYAGGLSLTATADSNTWYQWLNSTYGLSFGINGTAAAMSITSGGNVGIGTVVPTAPLDVAGAIRTLSPTPPTSGSGLEFLFSGGESYAQSFNRTSPAFLPLHIEGSVTTINLGSGGKVGINKSAPGSKLAVVGLPEYADNTAALAGNLTTGDFYRTSTGVVMVVLP